MRRGIWFVAGAAAGAYGVVRARRAAEAFTPDGMRDRWGAASLGARIVREEFRQGHNDAESDLRARYALVGSRPSEIASTSPSAIEGGTPTETNGKGES